MVSRDLRLRILTILGAGWLLGGGSAACGGSVVVDAAGTGGTSQGDGAGGGGPSGSTGPATAVAVGVGTTGAASSVAVGVGGSGAAPPAPLSCAPSQPTTNPNIPEEPPDMCFSAAGIAQYMAGGAPPGVGAACPGGVLCPGVESLLPYEPSCETVFVGTPYSVNGQCCYALTCGCCGRPFVVDGAARLAAPVRRSDWAELGASDACPGALAAVLRDAWLADALLEHASIASFSRFAMHLLALGAPPELVAGAHRAALDEVAHTEACFALASRFGGEALGPGPLSMAGAFGEVTLPEAAAAAVVEGCVGETIAALVASAELDVARDADVCAALARIADDEARHAELAWRFVRWAIARDPGAAAPVAEAFARAAADVEASAAADERPAPAADEAALGHYGRLSGGALARTKRRALADVIAPCARVLLGAVAMA